MVIGRFGDGYWCRAQGVKTGDFAWCGGWNGLLIGLAAMWGRLRRTFSHVFGRDGWAGCWFGVG